MFGCSRAVKGVIEKVVWAAALWAYYKVGSAAAVSNCVSQSKASGALEEEGTSFEELDGTDASKHADGATSEVIEYSACGVINSKEDARVNFPFVA